MGAINTLGTVLAISSLSLAMFGCSGQNNSASAPQTVTPASHGNTSQNTIELTSIDTLTISDESLDRCIKNTGRKYIEDINALSCNDQGIQSIEGIEQLTELRSLFLNYNEIQDLTPLTELTGLFTLYLADNNIQDISALSELKNLTKLAIQKNDIQDISPLKTLLELQSLYTRNNNIYDFSVLDNLELKVLAGVGQQDS
ncbi:MAG: leucine-rich repeat domain-containing protein [Shewanella psychromarinicola]|uniref:leucine-rich repeat domain-containing protein n=1 Tax=Shewanella psychromarinicola TaxID=2487742 RepID=UPI00300130B1